MSFSFDPIGVIRTPFHDVFGVPRQPGLVKSAAGVIKLRNDARLSLGLSELETFSHLWIVFVFDRNGDQPWRPRVRPPRLGGEKRVGVFASRSPHRPNPVGISAVRIERIEPNAKGGAELFVSGVDLLDQTPVLDLKPYLPYADAIPDAHAGWAAGDIPRRRVEIAEGVILPPHARALILETLGLDPRPSFQKRRCPVDDPACEGMRFGIDLLGVDVTYEIRGGGFRVLAVK